MAKNQQLKDARSQIDEIDGLLLELLNRRAALAQQVARGKKAELSGLPDDTEIIYYRPDREAQVLRRVCDRNQGPFPDRAVRTIYREVISATLALEQPLKVAYVEQSDGCALSSAVAHFGRSAIFLGVEDQAQALQSVKAGSTDVAMIAIGDRNGELSSQSLARVVSAGVFPIGERWVGGSRHVDQSEQLDTASGPIQLLILGRQRCEPTGIDRTLLVVDSGDNSFDEQSLQRMLSTQGQAVCIDTANNRWCVMVDGHLQDPQVQSWIERLSDRYRSVDPVSSWPAGVKDSCDG